LGSAVQQCLRHLLQGTVATTGNQRSIAGGERLGHQALCIAGLPGDPYRQFLSGFTPTGHCRPYFFVERLFAVQDQ